MLDSVALQGIATQHDPAICYVCQRANGAGPHHAANQALAVAAGRRVQQSSQQQLVYAGSGSGKPLCRLCVEGGFDDQVETGAAPADAQAGAGDGEGGDAGAVANREASLFPYAATLFGDDA